MNTFFFIGCRRSGTTMLREVLNAHPRIYCSFESGIMWLLRHMCLGGTYGEAREQSSHWAHHAKIFRAAGDPLKRYELSRRSWLDTRNAFYDSINHIAKYQKHFGEDKKSPFYIVGEKNPSEYAKDSMHSFIRWIFPEVRFIHLVRHPAGFASSAMRYGGNDPDSWMDIKDEDTFNPIKLWVENERRALAVEKEAPTIRIKYESLCADPVLWVHRLYTFLVPDTDDYTICSGADLIGESGNLQYGPLSVPNGFDGLKEIAQEYGYE